MGDWRLYLWLAGLLAVIWSWSFDVAYRIRSIVTACLYDFMKLFICTFSCTCSINIYYIKTTTILHLWPIQFVYMFTYDKSLNCICISTFLCIMNMHNIYLNFNSFWLRLFGVPNNIVELRAFQLIISQILTHMMYKNTNFFDLNFD